MLLFRTNEPLITVSPTNIEPTRECIYSALQDVRTKAWKAVQIARTGVSRGLSSLSLSLSWSKVLCSNLAEIDGNLWSWRHKKHVRGKLNMFSHTVTWSKQYIHIFSQRLSWRRHENTLHVRCLHLNSILSANLLVKSYNEHNVPPPPPVFSRRLVGVGLGERYARFGTKADSRRSFEGGAGVEGNYRRHAWGLPGSGEGGYP